MEGVLLWTKKSAHSSRKRRLPTIRIRRRRASGAPCWLKTYGLSRRRWRALTGDSGMGACTLAGSGKYLAIFTVTHDITKYTKAKVFSDIDKENAGFCTLFNRRGRACAADAERRYPRLRHQVLHRGGQLVWWATTRRCSLSGTRTIFPTSTTPSSATPRPTCARRRTTLLGFRDHAAWRALHCAATNVMSDCGIPDGYRHMHARQSHLQHDHRRQQRYWPGST